MLPFANPLNPKPERGKKQNQRDMDSLKMIKGYGKVQHDQSHLEDQQQHRNPKSSKPFIATFSIFAVLFLTLTVAFAFVSLVHHTSTESNQHHLNSADSIRVVCNVTRYPASCLAAISPSANATDPEAILALSLRASLHALSTLASSLGTKGHALADCKDLMDDALSRLNDSLSTMAAPPLTEAKIADVQTLVSASMTDQQTCLDGLEEVGDVAALAYMKKSMQRCSEYTSNSLAIVANIHNLLRQFHTPLH
ncbi:pectinesterase 3 [Abrus precatorius]|uniref:pectinesterase n=1 Tax=Abrus precatorius TaxID=3816 RepID=A0A8B8K5J8_ABRPR|nr:pectinesterase 3 [Abrus precatorius]